MKFYTHVSTYGSKILVRGYNNGIKNLERADFKPTLFVQSNTAEDWKSLHGDPLKPIKLDSPKAGRDYVKKYEDVEGFKIHGMTDFHYQYIIENYPGDIQYSIDQMGVWFLDIEVVETDPAKGQGGFPDVQKADIPIVLISIYDKTTKKTVVFGEKAYNRSSQDTFTYKQYKDEKTMLTEFLVYWQQNCPDIVSGWNTDEFDFPYLINRIIKTIGEDQAKKLSPFGLIRERMIKIRGAEVQTYDIIGVTQLDYLRLYKKFGAQNKKDSYTLDAIAFEELGENKVESPANNFQDWFLNHFDSFISYNAKDSQLVAKMDDKMKLLDLIISMTYLVKCNFNDVFGPVNTWDVFVYNHLHNKKIAIPPHTQKIGGEFEGAWVKDVVPGLYGWVMTFDFASLYPTIVRQWNISPETLDSRKENIRPDDLINTEEGLSKYAFDNDLTIAANGTLYHKDSTGIIPELMGYLLDGRKITKKEMIKKQQEYQSICEEISKRTGEV